MKPARFNLQARLAGTLVAVLVILGLGIWLQEIRDRREGEHTRRTVQAEQVDLIQRLTHLMGAPLQFFVTDYAPWDDMAKFIAAPNDGWAETNVHAPLENFKLEAVWMLHRDGSVLYATTRGNDPALRPLLPFPLPPEALQSLLAHPKPLHCFVQTPLGLLELQGEPIRTADNIARYDQGDGWLFAGELWDEERLASLAGLVHGKVSLAPAGHVPAATNPRDLIVTLPLADWQGRPLVLLEALFSPPTLANLEDDRVTDLLVFVLCGVAVLAVLLVTTYRWLVRPLRLVTTSLAQRDPRALADLATSSREFDEIGRLIARSYEQERELREAFEAFNAIDDAVFIVSTSTHVISYVNAGALRLLGRPRDELLQISLDRLLLADTGQPPRFDVLQYARVRHQAGHLLDIEFRRQLLQADGSPTHYVVVARDITERRQQEKQRLRAQRLESLGALAGGIAHDLNNMLTPVSLLLDDLSDPRNQPQPDLIASVRISVKRGASMLRQLLTFGRGIEGERKPIAIAELCADLGRIINSTFPKSVRLELQAPVDVGDVIGDATQLHQVLLNLCVNARDAMPDGGVLGIRATPLPVTLDDLTRWPDVQPGRHVLLEVSDTGQGIPPESIDRIFEPFFTTKSPDKGTGLGLSTSLGIIRGHGGCITVESTPGRGTIFRVVLPAVAGRATADGVTAGPGCQGHGRTVLVVEDESLVLRTLIALLLHAGWKVITAADGAAGLAVFHEHRQAVALVLTDISMAGTDGLEMARRLRQDAPAVPLVVMSGRIDETQRRRLQELHLRHVVNKPFTRDELFNVLSAALAASPARNAPEGA